MAGAERDVDPILALNVPDYVIGEGNSSAKEKPGVRQKKAAAPERRLPLFDKPGRAPGRREEKELSLAEKLENVRAYFGLLADFEERKGGVNSYRLVLTVDREMSNRELLEPAREFLRENFPRAQALVAVHRDTAHTHAHVYIHARQLDGAKVNLKERYFRLDEIWMRICAGHFKDRQIYDEHIEKKRRTLAYREQVREARAQC
jgi:hypothetical protein